jgi:thymidylate synthase (FAD)
MNVTLVDHMGSDLSVVNAARVSFSKESEWERKCTHCGTGRDENGNPTCWLHDDVCEAGECMKVSLSDKDTKLINYLAKHNHWTPFGHCFASFRIKAPIFVARQLGKHQVGLVWNEVSRRYVDDEPEFYIPETWRKRAENVKQGSADDAVDITSMDGFASSAAHPREINTFALDTYKALLEQGVCPEQARMVLPQSMYTEWIWSGSLAAFARVCKLRLDPHTQQETRYIAEEIDQHMAELFPVSWKALNAAPD